jgi:hypothetical protein
MEACALNFLSVGAVLIRQHVLAETFPKLCNCDARFDRHRVAPSYLARWPPEFRNRGSSKAVARGPMDAFCGGQRLKFRNLEGRVSTHRSVPVYGSRRCARRINGSTFRYGIRVIALPLFDSVKAKPPVPANAKARQFSLSEQPVNGGPMDVQIFGQFRDG